jgi:hypothetical protein
VDAKTFSASGLRNLSAADKTLSLALSAPPAIRRALSLSLSLACPLGRPLQSRPSQICGDDVGTTNAISSRRCRSLILAGQRQAWLRPASVLVAVARLSLIGVLAAQCRPLFSPSSSLSSSSSAESRSLSSIA